MQEKKEEKIEEEEKEWVKVAYKINILGGLQGYITR